MVLLRPFGRPLKLNQPAAGRLPQDRQWKLWQGVLGLLILQFAVFGVLLTLQPEEIKVQYLPDDAFYYLTLARNFAHLRSWTFDSGLSTTSGFHPVFAYLLALIHGLFSPSTNAFINLAILTDTLFTVLAMLLLRAWVRHFNHWLLALFVAVILSSRNFLYNSVSATEWAPALFVYLSYFTFLHRRAASRAARDYAALFCLGALATLCRTDFGWLAFSAFAVLAACHGKGSPGWRLALAGLLGAAAGVLLASGMTYYYTGELLQSSARIKSHGTLYQGKNFVAGPQLIGYMLRKAGLALLAFGVVATALRARKSPGVRAETADFTARRGPLLLFSAIGVAGYWLLYMNNAAVMPWYTSAFTLPVVLGLAALAAWMHGVWGGHRFTLLFSALGLALVGANVARSYPLGTERALWPAQRLFYVAGNYLQAAKLPGRSAGWSSGIVGYYQGGQVVNLDGLTNTNIYPYLISNRVPEYIAMNGIVNITDFEITLTTPMFRKALGVDDPDFLGRLQPVLVFGEDKDLGRMILWKLRPKK
jgi:hypothetical protein